MKRLMDAELNKGTLTPYEQYVYIDALEKLDNYEFMNSKNYTDVRLFTTTKGPSMKPTTARSLSTRCKGLGVSRK